jgi:inward rectifier potassium channel
VATQKPGPMLDTRARLLVERRGIRRSSLAFDAYHFLRTTTWPRVTLLFATLFVVTNLVFGVIYYVGPREVHEAHGFLDDFWFSVQTLATIGYGYLAPTGTFVNAVVTVESFCGIMLTALITGVFFARFGTPSARVLFSRVALITDHDGKRALLLRMANERTTAIVEATVHVYLTRDERLASGERMRRIYDIPVRRATSPVFAWSFLVVHPIDEASPLFGATPESLAASTTTIIVTMAGTDDQLAATVHARYAYDPPQILFDRRFVDLFKTDAQGRPYLDFGPIHDTEPLLAQPAVTSPANPA